MPKISGAGIRRASRGAAAVRKLENKRETKILEETYKLESGLMINELLQVQQPGDVNFGNYRSRIEDIVERKLVVAWPADRGMRLPVHPDQMLNFSIVRDGNAYSFTGLVDKTVSEPLPLVTIIVSSALQRVQRRQDFRVKCLIPLEIFATLPETTKGLRPVTLRLKTNTYDLSASGVSLRTGTTIPDGTFAEIRLSLPDGEPLIKAPCNVTHCYMVPENSKMFHTGIRFMTIDEKDKARIVRFIYRTQLRGLRD